MVTKAADFNQPFNHFSEPYMDNSFRFANTAMRLQQSGTGSYSTIPAESPFRVAPLIREIVQAAANRLMSETGLLRKNVESTAPCFAIRTRGFDDLALMLDALPGEVWGLVSGMLATGDIQKLFSTCTVMKACVEKYIDKAEQQYTKSAKKILDITEDDASMYERVQRKLTQYFDRHDFVKISLSKAKRKQDIVAALRQNRSIKLLHIDARNIDMEMSGDRVCSSFRNLRDATIELDISENNTWSNFDLSDLFRSVSAANSVSLLKLDCNNLRDIQRSQFFFNMLFSPICRIRNLSLAGTGLHGCLSDFGMSLLAYGLMHNQPARLETLNLSSTPAKPGIVPYPKNAGLLDFSSYHADLNPLLFDKFSREALKNDKKSGLQLIVEALKTNTTITAINLSDCQIGDKMAKIFAGSLQQNMSLQKLYLGNNPIKNDGIKALAKVIVQHRSLQVLNLALSEKIAKKGWIDFFAALSGNTSLRHLNLDSCAIGDTGAAALAAMLKTNGTLKELVLSNNRITVAGMTALAKSLDGHPSITLLDLAGNHVPLKHVSMLEHLVTGGIHVRVNTGIQYKTAKANGTSFGTLDELNKNADVIEHDDVWLETSW